MGMPGGSAQKLEQERCKNLAGPALRSLLALLPAPMCPYLLKASNIEQELTKAASLWTEVQLVFCSFSILQIVGCLIGIASSFRSRGRHMV